MKAEAIEQFRPAFSELMKKHIWLGYESLDDFVVDAVRLRIELLKL